MISQEQYNHLKECGFNPKICHDCQEIDVVLMELSTNSSKYNAAPGLYEACKEAHNLIVELFARYNLELKESRAYEKLYKAIAEVEK